jgi:hypothetical protein
VAIYDKDKSFSWGWMLGGTLLMFITSFFGGFVAAGAGITSPLALLGIALLCFFTGGFVIGWKSEGQTIIEGGLAAALAIVISLGIRGFALVVLEPVALLIGIGIPFGAGLLGAFIGELVQGKTIETDD